MHKEKPMFDSEAADNAKQVQLDSPRVDTGTIKEDNTKPTQKERERNIENNLKHAWQKIREKAERLLGKETVNYIIDENEENNPTIEKINKLKDECAQANAEIVKENLRTRRDNVISLNKWDWQKNYGRNA